MLLRSQSLTSISILPSDNYQASLCITRPNPQSLPRFSLYKVAAPHVALYQPREPLISSKSKQPGV